MEENNYINYMKFKLIAVLKILPLYNIYIIYNSICWHADDKILSVGGDDSFVRFYKISK
jgi:hypothetical protein